MFVSKLEEKFGKHIEEIKGDELFKITSHPLKEKISFLIFLFVAF